MRTFIMTVIILLVMFLIGFVTISCKEETSPIVTNANFIQSEILFIKETGSTSLKVIQVFEYEGKKFMIYPGYNIIQIQE